MIMNEKEGTKYLRSGRTGENTPFAKQSKEKERDKVNDNNLKMKKMSPTQFPGQIHSLIGKSCLSLFFLSLFVFMFNTVNVKLFYFLSIFVLLLFSLQVWFIQLLAVSFLILFFSYF